jgi:chaperonin cofactor prefoldin
MKPIARLIGETYGSTSLSPPPIALASHRRRRLWELPARWHCPLIGTCLKLSDLRQLARRVGVNEQPMSDYTLHALVVGHCDTRSKLTELLQHFLDERHAPTIRQFGKAKGGEAVLAFWRKALADGNIAEGLWAACTHAEIDDEYGKTIYGELHMATHQLGLLGKAERKRLLVLEQDNARLREEAANSRHHIAEALQERERSISALTARLAEAERQSVKYRRDEIILATASKTEALNAALHERNEILNQRLAVLEKRNAGHMAEIAELKNELGHTRIAINNSGAALDSASSSCADLTADQPAEARLAGRRVLCIGGRTGLIDHYRRLVEASGGRFLHHDGGQEENEHRIDAIVAGADAVVCQTGYVSHTAYWRLKSACKQRGLPCLFLKSGGITTFARNLEMLAAECIGGGLQPN